MRRNQFCYIWSNIHLVAFEEAKPESDEEEGDEDDPHGLASQEETEVWYHKAKPVLDHVESVSQKFCIHPGFCISIDEQMKKFKGRSAQTVRMKNKPIKEGFKFFAICDATEGFVYGFKPSGRLEQTRIADTVVGLAKELPRRDELSYVIGMDNYFTLGKAIKGCKDANIAVVGTARARRGWPPREFKNIEDKRFNTLYTLNDKDGFKIMRWVDNNVVTMVSTLHDGTETITRQRKRPRKTTTNMSFVDTVWGGDWVKEISIPGVIDDYNHWMLGVDKSDQLIAYYRPAIRVQRYWMAMMFHGLDILRTNTYIVYKNRTEDARPLDHKGFLIELLDAMIKRANYLTYRPTRQQSPTQATPRQQKKRRMGNIY